MPATKPSAAKLPPSLRVKVLVSASATICPAVNAAVLAACTTIFSSPSATSSASAPLTVSLFGVTAVIRKLPLLAALLNPETLSFCPTLKPSFSKPLYPSAPSRPMSDRVNESVAASTVNVPLSQSISTTEVGSSGKARKKVS